MNQNNNQVEIARNLLKEQIGDKHGEIVSIKQIHKGYTNLSFVVTYKDSTMYQVRFPHCGDLIDRQNELAVLNLLNNKMFVYFDPTTGIAIKKWIKGKCPIIPKWWKWRHVDQLFGEIKRIHSLNVPPSSKLKVLNLETYCKHLYRLKIGYQAKYLSIIDKYASDKVVINHTDINALNILLDSSKKIHLIDFEWCALASDYWDYANFIRESNIKFNKIDWRKYIDNFDMTKLKEMIFATSVYAYLWTWEMPQTKQIKKYRAQTLKQIHRSARAVDNENDEE